MITWGESLSKHPIPYFNGVALASQEDPVQEATDWVSLQSLTIVPSGAIFVLGLGGGYHLEALTKSYPRSEIVVIETNQELLESVEFEHANVKIMGVVAFEGWLNVHRERLIGPYCVLLHPSTQKRDAAIYWSLEQLLTGRSEEALNLHLTLRPELQNIFSNFQHTDQTLMSVKHVEQQVQKKGAPYDREARVWMALREIVK